MTQEEALRVRAIIYTADGGCGYCITDLVNQMVREFPEHKDIWEMRKQGNHA